MKRFEIVYIFFFCHVSLQTKDSYMYPVTVKKWKLIRVIRTFPDVGGGGQKGGEKEKGNYDTMLENPIAIFFVGFF